jgi:hypothetical protein
MSVSQAGQNELAWQQFGIRDRPVMHRPGRVDPPRPRLAAEWKLDTVNRPGSHGLHGNDVCPVRHQRHSDPQCRRQESCSAAAARPACLADEMRDYVKQCQTLPPGGVKGFAPNSALMIRMRNLSMGMMTRWPLRALIARQFQQADAITLKDY